MRHDPLCPLVGSSHSRRHSLCMCPLIDRVADREARRHHVMDVQGGPVRTCCSVCKTHVKGHVACVLREGYDGPLPEGHHYEKERADG